jgi:uncharacterized damage-inducible protein DinB
MNAKEAFGQWAQVREGLLQALDQLSDAQLGFVPRAGLWSLGTVARHIASCEEGWFRHTVMRELPDWPEYSAADYPTVAAVKALLTDVHARTEAYLEGIDAADVDRPVSLPWGSTVPLLECIWHVLEHEIHHRGEIFLMLGLLGMEAPDV